MIALWLGLALAQEHTVVGPRDTVERLAARLGDPELADAIRERNGLASGAQPVTGAILWMPDGLRGHVDQPGIVLHFRGEVQATLPGADPGAVTHGQELPAGSLVCTGSDGAVTLRLAVADQGDTHDDLTLFPDTCITLDAASARGALRHSLLSLRSGSVSVRAAATPAGAITVRTASGVTSGSEGGFRVHVEPDAARTEALDAAAKVYGAEREVVVPAGFGSRVHTGATPTAPVKLLLPGTPTAPENGAALVRPDFAWTPVPRALGYRVQVAASADFADLILLEPVDEALWEPERLFLPSRIPGLWWRVASVDKTGFIGRWSEPRALRLPEGLAP